MKARNHTTHVTLSLFVTTLLGCAASAYAVSVTVQAESGTLGSNYIVGSDAGTQYISNTSSNSGSSPGIAGRVASYSVTFPAAGTYNLYARFRVNAGMAADDSMFYGNGFGAKSPTVAGNWVQANNLWNVGYVTGQTNVVVGGGSATTGVWKWISLTAFTSGPSFNVTAGNLTQTFQIGAREDGFDLDKLLFGTSTNTFTVAELDAGGPGTPPGSSTPSSNPPPSLAPRDLVAGNLIQFNDNGTWSWYMDERAVVDVTGGKLVTGSDASGSGVGGSPRNGGVEAVIFDLQSGTSQRSTLFIGSPLGADDHNAPAFMVRPDGKYLSQWTGHNDNWLSYFSIFNGTAWEPYTTFDWTTVGAGANEQASYSNPHYLSAEDRTYTFVRSWDIKAMNILVSTDYGDTWTYYGKLNRRYPSAGYNPGYYRFSDNGVDRIDFICTESHPRDTLTSMYHGYISNGMSFKTDGTLVDSNLNDTNAPLSSDFMPIFTNGTVMPPGQTNYRCWNSDVQFYPDGTVQAIIHARVNQFVHPPGYPDTEDPNHAFFFCRFDRTNWTATYLCQAGYKVYSAEADYVGLGALNPSDPNTIYISTKYDPRVVTPGVFDTNQAYSSAREIWKGVTTNHGAGFTWTQITRDSVRDNLRPVVPRWNVNNTALLWFRANYSTAQIYDAAIVGIVEHQGEIAGPMVFVDATTASTTLSDGSSLTTGAGANQWHDRAGAFNGGSVLASADVSAENAPAVKTSVTAPGPGTYDVWVNFWGNPSADWRVKAGLTTNGTQIFRQVACQEVVPGKHTTALILTNNGTNFLYQAYVGRTTNSAFDVFVDDEPIQTGTASTQLGNSVRTWYEGISFAQVETFGITDVVYSESGQSAMVTWSSVPAELSLTTPTYKVQRKTSLNDTDWTTLATGVLSAGITTSYTDNAPSSGEAYYRVIRQ